MRNAPLYFVTLRAEAAKPDHWTGYFMFPPAPAEIVETLADEIAQLRESIDLMRDHDSAQAEDMENDLINLTYYEEMVRQFKDDIRLEDADRFSADIYVAGIMLGEIVVDILIARRRAA